jgi:phenylpropionate dioxygenase-like ring-hydroxylating dioxygenase large terminal subunit
MLSKEDNELLTRVGPGTPMGNLLRQYWLPVLFSYEVVADGSPERVRLLGEDLLAFRDTDGRVGMIAENCPHRGASLYFGRNEESGLRCIYHGWKFDCEGHCVDMPNEPEDTRFADKVRIKAYPCIEKAGTIWTYMGPERPAPPLPQLEWLDLPESHIRSSKRVQYSNWVQAMEGDIDQSHVSFVHSSLHVPEVTPGERPSVQQVAAYDKHPRFEIMDQPQGYTVGATRHTQDPEIDYTRITQWLLPFHTMTGVTGVNPSRPWRAWVPIDDYTTFVIGVSFHPLEPLSDRNLGNAARRPTGVQGGVHIITEEMKAPRSSKPFGAWRPIPSLENDFFQDREAQKNETFSGIREFWAQDAAPQLSMGVIFQRQYEHLGTTDRAIIQARRRLLAAAKDLRDNGTPAPGVWNPEWYMVRSGGKFHPADKWWYEETMEDRKAIPGTNADASV